MTGSIKRKAQIDRNSHIYIQLMQQSMPIMPYNGFIGQTDFTCTGPILLTFNIKMKETSRCV